MRFDQPTLKGARPIDLDGDVLPDTIDYSTQMNDPRPCDEVFNAATVLRLGTGAICEWPASEVVQITLGQLLFNNSKLKRQFHIARYVLLAKEREGLIKGRY